MQFAAAFASAGVVREAVLASHDRYVLHDGKFSMIDGAEFDLRPMAAMRATSSEIPLIDDDQLAAIVHTSGSTGDSKQIRKYWRTLREGTEINSAYLLEDSKALAGLVATVPPGHMWGLETSILLPLFSNTQVYSGNSSFPEDIRAAIGAGAGKTDAGVDAGPPASDCQLGAYISNG